MRRKRKGGGEAALELIVVAWLREGRLALELIVVA